MTSTTRADAPRVSEPKQLANWKVGAAMAGVAGIASFQHSLLPRSSTQQAIVTVGSMALAYGVGVAANAISNEVDDATGLDQFGSRAAVAGAGALAVLGTTLALRGRPVGLALDIPHLSLEAGRTGAAVLAGGAVLGAALLGEQALVDRIQDHVPGGAATAHAAIFGAAALGVGAMVFGRTRSSAVSVEAERAYLASTGGAQGSSANPVAFDAARFDEITRLRSQMTTVPALRPGALLPDGAAGGQGVKFLNEATPAAEIARVMGTDAASVKDPIRIYGGMQHAATHEQLAQQIFDEARTAGAFERGHVILYVPSGTGHVNPMPVAATEYLTGGDVASVAMQYGDKPSIQSFGKRDEAADLFRRVLTKFSDHIETLPAAERPKLMAYGESLGAWGIQDSFLTRGEVGGIADSGLDAIVNVGTPRFSKLRADAIGLSGQRLDDAGRMFEFNDVATLKALPAEQREGVRAFLLTHHNDPVNKISPRMFFTRPEWLAQAEHGTGVPRKMKWYPGVTGVQGLVDNANGARVVPGILEKTGHDYRAEMAPVMSEVIRSGASDAQLAGINGALNQLELARVHAPAPAIRIPVPVPG
ncbi:MAG: putative rane protein [Thermoleophilia bacterium]|nr:putative rane protein [Thermoleophilia bacterium]